MEPPIHSFDCIGRLFHQNRQGNATKVPLWSFLFFVCIQSFFFLLLLNLILHHPGGRQIVTLAGSHLAHSVGNGSAFPRSPGPSCHDASKPLPTVARNQEGGTSSNSQHSSITNKILDDYDNAWYHNLSVLQKMTTSGIPITPAESHLELFSPGPLYGPLRPTVDPPEVPWHFSRSATSQFLSIRSSKQWQRMDFIWIHMKQTSQNVLLNEILGLKFRDWQMFVGFKFKNNSQLTKLALNIPIIKLIGKE